MRNPLLGSEAVERLVGAVAFAGQLEMSLAAKALAGPSFAHHQPPHSTAVWQMYFRVRSKAFLG